MRFFFFAALFMIPLGRLVIKPLFESAGKVAPLSPSEITVALLVAAYGVSILFREEFSFTRAPGGKTILMFPAWCVISLLLNMNYYRLGLGEVAFSSLYLLRWIAYSFFYFAAYEVVQTRTEVKKVTGWLFAGALAFCGFGLVQAAFFSDFALWLYPDALPYIDYDPQGHRLVSTLLDPNIAAGYILIFLLVALSFCVHGVRHWSVPFVALLGALTATLSRGGVLGFAVGTCFLLACVPARRKRAIGILLLGFLVVLALYPVLKPQIEEAERFRIDDPSAMGRVEDWKLALEIISDNWLTGIGFNTFGFISSNYGAAREGGLAFGLAGDLVMILVLTGLIGLVIYVRIYRRVLASLSRVARESHNQWERAFANGVRAATVGVLASSFFTTLVLYPQIMAILWILWALGERLREPLEVGSLGGGLRFNST